MPVIPHGVYPAWLLPLAHVPCITMVLLTHPRCSQVVPNGQWRFTAASTGACVHGSVQRCANACLAAAAAAAVQLGCCSACNACNPVGCVVALLRCCCCMCCVPLLTLWQDPAAVIVLPASLPTCRAIARVVPANKCEAVFVCLWVLQVKHLKACRASAAVVLTRCTQHAPTANTCEAGCCTTRMQLCFVSL